MPQLGPHLCQEVADEAEVVGEVRRVEFGDVPAWDEGVDAVHERRVVAHLFGERGQQVTHAELGLDIDVEVAHHDDPAVGADRFATPAELARFHVALEDVTPSLLSKDTPETSSKQITSYWATSPRRPF